MKFKARNIENELYNEMRYNENTIGCHIEIKAGVEKNEKKYCGAISILSLMISCNNYEKIESEVENKIFINIIHKMFDNVQNDIIRYHFNKEMIGYKKNDIIKFKNGEYLILNAINNTYLYLINNNEYKNDVSIIKVLYENEQIKYMHIEENEEFEYVIKKIFLDFKNDILEVIN